MKTIIELTEKDIAQIIANSFDCDTNKVCMSVQTEYVGQGPMECKVHRCKATVTITQEGKHTHA